MLGREEFLARWGDHGDEGDELFEVDLKVSVLVEVRKELIQSVAVLDFLCSRKSEWRWNIWRKLWTVNLTKSTEMLVTPWGQTTCY